MHTRQRSAFKFACSRIPNAVFKNRGSFVLFFGIAGLPAATIFALGPIEADNRACFLKNDKSAGIKKLYLKN